MKNNIKFVFFGTGNFAVKVLEILCQNGFVPELVITTPNKPKGRKMELQPSPIKQWAENNNKIAVQPEKLMDVHDILVAYHDLFIVADYGKIIPIEILNIPKYGALNMHPSLLPKFRGASPIQSFILSGEEETGATIILMDQDIDHGPIIAKSEIRSAKSETYKELESKLAVLGGELLVKTIPDWLGGKIKAQEQNHSQATFTKKITKEDGKINLEKDSQEIIERKVRALTPWPGAYFFANNKRIIITEAETKDGKLVIKRVKPEGKNEMLYADFLRGNH